MIPSSLPEAELLELVSRAQDGDTEAFECVYDQFFVPIYRYTAFRAPSDMVEDLVADVFVKAWEKLYTYRPQRGVPFGAWIFRIARHTIIDAYRRERDFAEVSEDIEDTDDFNRADASVKRKDLMNIVRRALYGLPKKYREVLLLSYMAELPTNEVARVLRRTEGGVRILRFRALKKLELLLPDDFQPNRRKVPLRQKGDLRDLREISD